MFLLPRPARFSFGSGDWRDGPESWAAIIHAMTDQLLGCSIDRWWWTIKNQAVYVQLNEPMVLDCCSLNPSWSLKRWSWDRLTLTFSSILRKAKKCLVMKALRGGSTLQSPALVGFCWRKRICRSISKTWNASKRLCPCSPCWMTWRTAVRQLALEDHACRNCLAQLILIPPLFCLLENSLGWFWCPVVSHNNELGESWSQSSCPARRWLEAAQAFGVCPWQHPRPW